MKVAVTLASAAPHISGVQRHALNLVRCLLMQSDVTAIDLIATRWQMKFTLDEFADVENVHVHEADIGSSAWQRNLWYYRDLPKLARNLGSDIVHLAYPVPIRTRAFSAPVVTTLHDLYPYDVPENFGFHRVWANRLALWQCLRASDAIACVSQSTYQRLKDREPSLALAKAVTIPNCVEPSAQSVDAMAAPGLHDLLTDPFLLCVAQHRRNKNVLLLLRAYAGLLRERRLALRTRLVIVGIRGPETHRIIEFIRQAGLGARVLLLEGISCAALQWCYRHCELLVAPSLTEGFGLPVAEGLLAGSRIVCSDIPAFRELAENRCNYFALGKQEEFDLAAAIEAALLLDKPAPIHLPHLAPEVVGEQYVALYQRLLHGGRCEARSPVSPLTQAEGGTSA